MAVVHHLPCGREVRVGGVLMSWDPNMSDRRQFGRRCVHEHAIAHFPGRPALYCIIRDLSVRGAFLLFRGPVFVPFWFQLVVEHRDIKTLCEVRHQSTPGVGVMFIEEAGRPRSIQMLEPMVRRTNGESLVSSIGIEDAGPPSALRLRVLALKRE